MVDKKEQKRTVLKLLVAGFLTLGLFIGWADAKEQRAPVVNGALWSSDQEDGNVFIYLPLIMRSYPPPPPQFGVQLETPGNASVLSHLERVRNHWVRFSAFWWDRIEYENTDPTNYEWGAINEAGLIALSDAGMETIAVVKHTPTWAQKMPGVSCGPIRQDALGEFSEFVTALVERYSRPPYNIRYWELGNEPDVDPILVAPDSVFGCWGDGTDPYYGGGYYAEMLKVAYPAIKAADPRAQVLIGGLLLDCDPDNPPEGRTCRSARFLEGILRNGGGDYFDIVSFHGYALYNGTLQADMDLENWKARGGVVMGKIDFIRETLSAYDVDKPLMLTEGSLVCPEQNTALCDPPGQAFYEAQVDYVVWLFVRNWTEGLLGTTWYQFDGPGWRYSGMLDQSQTPKPVYYAYEYMTEMLSGMSYDKALTQYPGLQAYAFYGSGKRIWVLWAPDETNHTITLPTGFQAVYDKYGTEITPVDDSLTVNHPVYVELSP